MRPHLKLNHFTSWRAEDGSVEIYQGDRAPIVTLCDDNPDTLSIIISAPWLMNPAPNAPRGRLWKLWEYEVVELFISGADGHYLELEFGPWEHHLALSFSNVRSLSDDQCVLDKLEFWRSSSSNVSSESRWGVSCEVDRSLLPPPHCLNSYALGINAFWCFDRAEDSSHSDLESQNEVMRRERVYSCAAQLPGMTPNFHQPMHFPLWSLKGFSLDQVTGATTQ